MRKNKWREVYDSPQSKDPWKNGLPDFALYLDVEPTNNCNFKCSFCVSQNNQMKRPKGFMTMATFQKICEQAQEYGCKGIRFLRWGEPLLNKYIIDMIRMAKRYNLLTHLTTNGYHLTEDMCLDLVRSGLDSIIISFQGTTCEEYKKFRGNSYKIITSNLYRLIKIRNQRKSDLYITISTTLTDETQEQADTFKKEWLNFVDDVSIGYTWFKRLKNKSRVEDSIKRAKKLPHHFKCQEVMVKLSIDWDGTVSPCCLDYDQELTVGNIHDTKLNKIWESKDVQAIRTLLSNKNQDMFKLCSTCELNYGFRGEENE